MTGFLVGIGIQAKSVQIYSVVASLVWHNKKSTKALIPFVHY